MRKPEIIDIVARKTGVPRKTCEQIIDGFINEIANGLIGGETIVIAKFATFFVGRRRRRRAMNPYTGLVQQFPEVKTVHCKASKILKDAINGRQ